MTDDVNDDVEYDVIDDDTDDDVTVNDDKEDFDNDDVVADLDKDLRNGLTQEDGEEKGGLKVVAIGGDARNFLLKGDGQVFAQKLLFGFFARDLLEGLLAGGKRDERGGGGGGGPGGGRGRRRGGGRGRRVLTASNARRGITIDGGNVVSATRRLLSICRGKHGEEKKITKF